MPVHVWVGRRHLGRLGAVAWVVASSPACSEDESGQDTTTGETPTATSTGSTGQEPRPGTTGTQATDAATSSPGASTTLVESSESTASGGSSDETGATQPPSCPPVGPDDVGVLDPDALVDSERIVVSESGTIVENVHVHGDIEIVDGATDVTIRNFRITTDGYWGIFVRDGSNIVIEDGEIDGLDGIDDAIRGGGYTARRLYIHDIGGDSFKADGDNVIECNYVTDIGQADEAHGDGVQMMGAGEIYITENNFDLTSGSLTACIFPFGTDPVSGPVWAEANRLNGGAYIVYCHENLHMIGNVFGEDYAYGPVTDTCGTWMDNTWESTGEPVEN